MEKKIAVVMRQTDFTSDIAREKLMACDYDEIKCIKAYLGIVEKVTQNAPVSVNQQIYREIRNKLSGQGTSV